MEHIFEMMKTWDHFGQGLFLLILLFTFCGILSGIGYFLLVLVRGWPPDKTIQKRVKAALGQAEKP